MTTLDTRRRLNRRRIRITGWTALTSLLVTIVGFLTYFHIVFMADREATLEVFNDERVVVTERDGSVIMTPSESSDQTGLLFFPGARVDPYSYLYPLLDVAASGVTVVIMDPLFHMALADTRNIDELTSVAPEVERWTLAGHSLGGVRACMLADHPEVTGLILMASYCATDISPVDIAVIQILASNDGLIATDALRDARGLLPGGSTTVTIDGANHASFGTYGDQPGDAVATLSPEAFRRDLTEAIAPLLGGG
jgi:hypothetical protein